MMQKGSLGSLRHRLTLSWPPLWSNHRSPWIRHSCRALGLTTRLSLVRVWFPTNPYMPSFPGIPTSLIPIQEQFRRTSIRSCLMATQQKKGVTTVGSTHPNPPTSPTKGLPGLSDSTRSRQPTVRRRCATTRPPSLLTGRPCPGSYPDNSRLRIQPLTAQQDMS